MQVYSDPSRESDPYALPDVEVWYEDGCNPDVDDDQQLEPGFYYWSCFPGCLPDGEPIGPFLTEIEAIEAAQEGDWL